MKKLYLVPFSLCVLSTFLASSQVIRPFSARYTNPSVRGNIVYVSNSIIAAQGANTSQVPPGGTAQDNDGPAINIDIDTFAPDTLLSFGSNWKYHSDGTRPAGWETVAFNDGTWLAGNGKFGFRAGQTTCVRSANGTACGNATPCTPTINCNKYTAYYFRRILNIANPSNYTNIQLNLKRLDGIVIYVNGVEAARNNMPAGTPTQATLASAGLEPGADEDYQVNISPTLFTSGNNTIAVEIHTRTAQSDEMSFDMQILGGSTTATFNSSTADLNLSSCSEVLWAGLYWGADQGENGVDTAWIGGGYQKALLKLPGGSYQVINAQQTDKHSAAYSASFDHTGYSCFADITSIINKTNPNGTYGIANVLGPIGIENACGGWTIVIAYSNPILTPRNLTVFDGHAIVNMDDGVVVDVTINGFRTPPSGAVTCELGAVVFDGDRGGDDQFLFRQQGAGAFYNLTPNATSNINDMWNSTISYKGAVVTTRNPAYNNTLGYDADIIDLPNAGNAQLGNNRTSATVRFSSNEDNHFLSVLTTSILQYNPAFNLSKSSVDVNGGTLKPGDILRYTISYDNGGNDASQNTKIIDSLPYNLSYVPGTIKIDGVTKTDVLGDDQAYYDPITRKIIYHVGTGANASSGGTVSIGASGTVTFDAVAALSCHVLACGATIKNSAKIEYAGVTSSQALYDSSGVFNSACLTHESVADNLTGACFTPTDTTMTNNCSSNRVILPWARYAGYNFYSAKPFIPANVYNPYTPITSSGTYYAYFNSGLGCADTITINVIITLCIDIDDDNDGIPDYVELNNPVALQDADSDNIPSWNDATYAGFIDHNGDGFNDNFDPLADVDSDGMPNYLDTDFAGFTDNNNDGVNDAMDKDLDGIVNNLDLDSDNDGIPDVVESGGVDANGDGRIDNYNDTDNDGFSQNVDGNNTGVTGSGNGLGAVNTDGDSVANYLDLDSDNDGIPDAAEVYGTDTNNDAKIDGYTDTDNDGLSDNIDSDVANDGNVENEANALLRTGPDANGDGRADNYPYKNIDSDSKTNPYDLDSDGDGITDVKEAAFTDADWNGRIDGTYNVNGWSNTIAALASLSMPNTDVSGRANIYDIDSDDDGIPDNVEGQLTNAYKIPSAVDTDADGIADNYDNFSGFGGDGIHVCDTDGDTVPDYLDSDTDNDGIIDIIEGNDFNFNGQIDDDVTLAGIDTDHDGLDDHFDNNNLARGTSLYMGNNGSQSGDPAPGSTTVVQRSAGAVAECGTERDWRCLGYVLPCEFTSFKAVLQNQQVQLEWKVYCDQELKAFVIERSIDGSAFVPVQTITASGVPAENNFYKEIDNISSLKTGVIYYRIKTIDQNNRTKLSSTVPVNRFNQAIQSVQVVPSPVNSTLKIIVAAGKTENTQLSISDATGKVVLLLKEKIRAGHNVFSYPQADSFSNGIYYLRMIVDNQIIVQKFSILR